MADAPCLLDARNTTLTGVGVRVASIVVVMVIISVFHAQSWGRCPQESRQADGMHEGGPSSDTETMCERCVVNHEPPVQATIGRAI